MLEQGRKVFQERGLRSFLRDSFGYLYSNYFSALFMPLVIQKFKQDWKLDPIDFAFSFQSFGVSIKPMQIKSEISKLCNVLERPKVILEIGTANGGTLFLFSRFADPNAIMISIDLRNSKYRKKLYYAFEGDRQRMYLLRGDSHSMQILRDVNGILQSCENPIAEMQIDFLFIDGDHSYEGVKKDFEMYSPMVRQGGIIALHDIVRLPSKNSEKQVAEFWNEMQERFIVNEFVEDYLQEGFGIGVIRK